MRVHETKPEQFTGHFNPERWCCVVMTTGTFAGNIACIAVQIRIFDGKFHGKPHADTVKSHFPSVKSSEITIHHGHPLQRGQPWCYAVDGRRHLPEVVVLREALQGGVEATLPGETHLRDGVLTRPINALKAFGTSKSRSLGKVGQK